MELNLAASLRTALRSGGDRVAAKGLFHAAWLVLTNRWINIPARPLTRPLGGEAMDVPGEDAGVRAILDSIASLKVQDVGRQVLEYLNAGYSGDRLLHEMGASCSGTTPTLRSCPPSELSWKNGNGVAGILLELNIPPDTSSS
jgi:hypothetical protein